LMKKIIRHIISSTYKPLVKKYLAKERTFKYNNLSLQIHPDVFHPGFFYSTKLMLAQLKKIPVEGKRLLELGAGSGLIALYAHQRKAIVTATDINPIAVDYLHRNSSSNHANIRIIQADLFNNIPASVFDIIIINPPYYKKKPVSHADYAWHCGENGEYFDKLFSSLATYIHQDSLVLMVLCDGCDIPMIKNYGSQYQFAMHQLLAKKNIVETNFIYRIIQAA
jgi:release factor glutamine methyltransferase